MPQIVCGSSCTFFIDNNHNIWSFGYNNNCQLGHKPSKILFKKSSHFSSIKQITSLCNIKMIDCGTSHAICLNYDGIVFTFGSQKHGELGINDTKEKQTLIPQQLSLPPIQQISCGYHFSICLSFDGIIYSFGRYSPALLGRNINENNYATPEPIPNLINIEYIFCGGIHVICKSYDSKFYSWGEINLGQLGLGNFDKYTEPTQCLNWPENIIDIKCGSNHSLILTKQGNVYSFGSNTEGQLGLKYNHKAKRINIPRLIPDIPEIKTIQCGYFQSRFIDIEDNLWICGYNKFGQLGIETTENIYKPIIHPLLPKISYISSKGDHTFVITITNNIYAFGNNNSLQLGIKTNTTIQMTPKQVFEDKINLINTNNLKSARK